MERVAGTWQAENQQGIALILLSGLTIIQSETWILMALAALVLIHVSWDQEKWRYLPKALSVSIISLLAASLGGRSDWTCAICALSGLLLSQTLRQNNKTKTVRPALLGVLTCLLATVCHSATQQLNLATGQLVAVIVGLALGMLENSAEEHASHVTSE